MKTLSTKVTVTNASHELRVRLRPDAKLTFDSLKTQAEKTCNQPLSDSAYFNLLLKELACSLPPTFISVSEALSIPVAKVKPKNKAIRPYGSYSIEPK